MKRFTRVINQLEERRLLPFVEKPDERSLHERAQAPRSISKDVLELLELAMDVADDVNRGARERANGLQVRNLREPSRDSGKAVLQRPEANGVHPRDRDCIDRATRA
jgi:hypothetical protein